MALPLQSIPGWTELAVIAMNLLLLAAIGYALVLLIRRLTVRPARVDELERQVGRLDRRVEELENTSGAGTAAGQGTDAVESGSQ